MIPAIMTGITLRIMRSGRRIAMAVIPTWKVERRRARKRKGRDGEERWIEEGKEEQGTKKRSGTVEEMLRMKIGERKKDVPQTWRYRS